MANYLPADAIFSMQTIGCTRDRLPETRRLEIMALHEKMDALRSEQLAAMLDNQERQFELLTRLLAQANIGEPA